MTHPCPVCGQERPRRANYTRPATCTHPECVRARKGYGGRQGRGRPKPGNAHAWAIYRRRRLFEEAA